MPETQHTLQDYNNVVQEITRMDRRIALLKRRRTARTELLDLIHLSVMSTLKRRCLDSDQRSYTLTDSKDEWFDEYERNHPLEITSEPESVEDLRPTVESETEDVVNETMDLPSPDEEPANRDATVEDEIGGKQEIENFIEDQSEKIKEENGIQEPMVNRTSYQNFMIRMKESIEDCNPI